MFPLQNNENLCAGSFYWFSPLIVCLLDIDSHLQWYNYRVKWDRKSMLLKQTQKDKVLSSKKESFLISFFTSFSSRRPSQVFVGSGKFLSIVPVISILLHEVNYGRYWRRFLLFFFFHVQKPLKHNNSIDSYKRNTIRISTFLKDYFLFRIFSQYILF